MCAVSKKWSAAFQSLSAHLLATKNQSSKIPVFFLLTKIFGKEVQSSGHLNHQTTCPHGRLAKWTSRTSTVSDCLKDLKVRVIKGVKLQQRNKNNLHRKSLKILSNTLKLRSVTLSVWMITHPKVRLKSLAKTMKLLLTKKITLRLQGVKKSSTRNTRKIQKQQADPRLSNRVRALSTMQRLSLMYRWRKSCKRSANNSACSFLTDNRHYIGWRLKRPPGSSRPQHQSSSLR